MNRVGDFIGDIITQIIAGAVLLSIPWIVSRRRRYHQRLAEQALNKARVELAQQHPPQQPQVDHDIDQYARYAERNDPRLHTTIDGGDAYSRLDAQLETAEQETRKARRGRDAWRAFWLLNAHGPIAVTLRVLYYLLLAFWVLFMAVGIEQFATDGQNDPVLDVFVVTIAGAIIGAPVAAIWALAIWATHHHLKKKGLGT